MQRERRALQRRRTIRAAGEREAQQLQAFAAAAARGKQARRRQIGAYALWTVAAVIAIAHFFEHAGAIRLMSPGLEDLAIGWPVAFLIALGGFLLLRRS